MKRGLRERFKKKEGFVNSFLSKIRKRGLSTVIVTLLFILLSLVAIGIFWVVVRNVLKSGTEQASTGLGQLLVSLELQNVNINPNGDIGVSVKRNVGQGDLTGIAFIVSDGTNSPVIKKDTTLQELGTQTFIITASELGSSFGLVKEVSIVPIISLSMGNVVDKEEISNKDVLKGLGAVSWWKLDGNANDEIGGNNGNVIGNLNFVEGKYGKAGSFDGTSYLDSTFSTNTMFNKFSMVAWYNCKTPGGTIIAINSVNSTGTYYGSGMGIETLNQNFSGRVADLGILKTDLNSTGSSCDNNWHYGILTYDGINANIYVDGLLNKTYVLNYNLVGYTNRSTIGIGTGGHWGGINNSSVDEVILFNQSLTAQQIKLLYQLDLTSS